MKKVVRHVLGYIVGVAVVSLTALAFSIDKHTLLGFWIVGLLITVLYGLAAGDKQRRYLADAALDASIGMAISYAVFF
jgi:hypothetical protein